MNAEITPQQVAQTLRKRPADAHKGTMGHALLMAGSHGIGGCAVLAAESCLRSGVGKLTVLSDESNRIILQTSVPEAIFTSYNLPTLDGFASLGIGPGIGFDTQTSMYHLLRETDIPVVLDADALHILAMQPQMMKAIEGRSILTPHLGEMKHLAEGLQLEQGDLLKCAAIASRQFQCIIVLKGHPTHICMPNGDILSCPRGNAGMATAGSGDVLTGIITGLLAQGYSIREAAQLGVWLHATAGDAAAQKMGQECMLARDIIRHMPQAFKELNEIKNKTI